MPTAPFFYSSDSSSDEDESISDSDVSISTTFIVGSSTPPSSPSAPPSRPLSRKAQRVRTVLLHGLLCIFVILHRNESDSEINWPPHPRGMSKYRKRPRPVGELETIKKPWCEIQKILDHLSGAVIPSHPRARTVLGLLIWFCERRLLPLTKKKTYIKSLKKDEARSTHAFLEVMSNIPSIVLDVGKEVNTAIEEVSLYDADYRLLARLAIFALAEHSVGTLNLSYLLDLPQSPPLTEYIDLFGRSADEVTNLVMSHCELEIMYDWVPWPFPKAHAVDLTHNPKLTIIPFYLAFIPHFQYVRLTHPSGYDIYVLRTENNLRLNASPSTPTSPSQVYALPRSELQKLPAPSPTRSRKSSSKKKQEIGSSSLVTILIKKVLDNFAWYNKWLDEGIPPHLRSILNESYICEKCGRFCRPDSPHYKQPLEVPILCRASKQKDEVIHDSDVRKRTVFKLILEGWFCATCKILLRERTKPPPEPPMGDGIPPPMPEWPEPESEEEEEQGEEEQEGQQEDEEINVATPATI
ncbi:hypothetical protein M231_01788 [Tremella mesenterica]|uniref:Uncharacterized protein n=1 Tax=Tremella mesenterica TaxID=5217 RepID=A0A4Q1BSK4_TREME|nr:hypothetical protein M231_01788 [Tremella mesenterica]